VLFRSDTKSLKRVLSKIPNEIYDEVRVEMKQVVSDIQREARVKHRFKNHTGMLRKSIATKVLDKGFTGEVYFDTDIADYGIYVHEGHGTWERDPFITDAFDRNEPRIRENLEKAIQRGINNAEHSR
jgi:hypothetical protein